MRRSTAFFVTTVALVSLTSPSGRPPAQTPAPLAGAKLDHIAITVRDIQASLKTFTDILGVEAPPTRDAMLNTVGGDKVGWKVAFLSVTGSFFVEIDQPMTPGPMRDGLER